MKKHDNPDYHLVVNLAWQTNKDKHTSIKCPVCNGTGKKYYGPFSNMYGEEDDSELCPKCFGTKWVDNPDISIRPQIPKEFFKHMRNAYEEYFGIKRRRNLKDD